MKQKYNVKAKAFDGELTDLRGVYPVDENENGNVAMFRTAGGNITVISLAQHKWIKLDVCS